MYIRKHRWQYDEKLLSVIVWPIFYHYCIRPIALQVGRDVYYTYVAAFSEPSLLTAATPAN